MPLLARETLGQTGGDRPVIFEKIDAVGPGETLMLFGHRLSGARATGVRIKDEPSAHPDARNGPIPTPNSTLSVLQADDHAVMVEIPQAWQRGVYVVRIDSPAGSVESLVINRPQAWWLAGEGGGSAGPGTVVRVFGRNFKLGGQAVARAVLRDSRGQFHTLPIANLNAYSLQFQLPAAAPEGAAEVFVHNGYGGATGWAEPLPLQIKPADPWPSTIYNVREFGATGDSTTDDTAAFHAALAKSEANGGGEVFVPRGIYKITAQLNMPKRTVLRGQNRDLSWLNVPPNIPQFNSLLAGSGEFAVEDLSMVAKSPLRMITAPDVPSMYTERLPWGLPGEHRAHNISLRRVRIQHLRYQGRVGSVQNDRRRSEEAGPSTVALAGSNIVIADSEIVSSGMPFILHDLLYGSVTGNELGVGRNGWYGFWGARKTVFEGNTIRGQDLEASYGSFGNYDHGDGMEISQVYIAKNKFLDSFGGEREAITFDSPGDFPWKGRIAQAGSDSLAADGTAWNENAFRGLACIIAAGKGLGQHRRIVSNTASRLVVDRAWDVIPDAGSVVSVGPYRRDVVVHANESQDCNVGVQLWGGGFNYIIDGNTTTRSGGFWAASAEYNRPKPHFIQAFLPCYFTQWLDNTVHHPMAYAEQNTDSVTMWGMIGILTRDTVTTPDASILNFGNLFRGNQLSDGARIALTYFGGKHRGEAETALKTARPPVGLDNVIEGNTISDSRVGIEIEPGYEGTLVRTNTMNRVDVPSIRGKWKDRN
jgi:hypothetical protein